VKGWAGIEKNEKKSSLERRGKKDVS